MRKYLNLRAQIALALLFAFLVNNLGPLPAAQADEFLLPKPGTMVHLSPTFNPPTLKGIKVHPDHPFRLDFILDKGDGHLSNDALKGVSEKLIKYFLASLTTPEKDLWVNLSPYEKNRIVPPSFGLTEMGRDLLAEDYMLKQITASLIYPEDGIGKKFWKRVYEEAAKKFGTTDIPVNTFNKVWIVPGKAVVYENARAGTAYVVESNLQVMLEQDYLALSHSVIPAGIHSKNDINTLGSQIVREIVIPALTKEVNTGKNFSQLRQVYNSLILATWYKKKIKDSILNHIYTDKNKVAGVNINDPQEKQNIYERYLQAFKKGAYNYIKEEQDPITQQMVPRKYFSGGYAGAPHVSYAMASDPRVLEAFKTPVDSEFIVGTDLENARDRAMTKREAFFEKLDPISALVKDGKYEKAKKELIEALRKLEDKDFNKLADVIDEDGLPGAQKSLEKLDETYLLISDELSKGLEEKYEMKRSIVKIVALIGFQESEISKLQARQQELRDNPPDKVKKRRLLLRTLQEANARQRSRYLELKIEVVASLLRTDEEPIEMEVAEIGRQVTVLENEADTKEREKDQLIANLLPLEQNLKGGADLQAKILVFKKLLVWIKEQLAVSRAIPYDRLIPRERVIAEIDVSKGTDAKSLWAGVVPYLMADFDIEKDQRQNLVDYLAGLGFGTPEDMEKEKLFQTSLNFLNIAVVRDLINRAPPEVVDADLQAYVVGEILQGMGFENDEITDEQRRRVKERLGEIYFGFTDNEGFVKKRRMNSMPLIELKEEIRQQINEELRPFGYEEAIKGRDTLVFIIKKNRKFRDIFLNGESISTSVILSRAYGEEKASDRLALMIAFAAFQRDVEPYFIRIDPAFKSKAMTATPSLIAERSFRDQLVTRVFLLMQANDFYGARSALVRTLKEYKGVELQAIADLIGEGELTQAQKELNKLHGQYLSRVIELGHSMGQENLEEILIKQIELMEIVEQMIRLIKYNDYKELVLAKAAEFGRRVVEDVKGKEEILAGLRPKVEALVVELTGQAAVKEEQLRVLLAGREKLLARVVGLNAELKRSLSAQGEVAKKRAIILRSVLGSAKNQVGEKVVAIDRKIDGLKNEIEAMAREKEELAFLLAADEEDLRQDQEALEEMSGPLLRRIRVKRNLVQRAFSRLQRQLDYWALQEGLALAPPPEYTDIILKHFNRERAIALIHGEEKAVLESGRVVNDRDFLTRIIERLRRITKASEEQIRGHLQEFDIDIAEERKNAVAPAIEEALGEKKEPFVIVQDDNKEFQVMATTNRKYFSTDQFFDKDEQSHEILKEEIAKKIRYIFSNRALANIKMKTGGPLKGIYDVEVSYGQGRYALYARKYWYRGKFVLAIVAFESQGVHSEGTAGQYQTSFNNYLKEFGIPKKGDDVFNAQLFEPVLVNKAMSIPENTGGIDLTPANMKVDIKNAEGIQFHLNTAMLAQMQYTSGFVPANISIQPMTDLREFLGFP